MVGVRIQESGIIRQLADRSQNTEWVVVQLSFYRSKVLCCFLTICEK